MTFTAFLQRVPVPEPAEGAARCRYDAVSFEGLSALCTSDGARIGDDTSLRAAGAAPALLVPPWRAHLVNKAPGECVSAAEVATGAAALREAAQCAWMGRGRAAGEWESAVAGIVGAPPHRSAPSVCPGSWPPHGIGETRSAALTVRSVQVAGGTCETRPTASAVRAGSSST